MSNEPIHPRWGRFDYDDWFDSWVVQAMSWKEASLYGLLLKLQFKHGAIPADPKVCGRMLGVGASGPEFEEFAETFAAVVDQFDPVDGDPSRLQNARQAKEREAAVAKIKQKIKAGKASGKSRRRKKKERPLNGRSNTRSTTDATQDIDVDLDTDRDIGTNNVNTVSPTADEFDPVENLVALVSDLRESVGLAPLRGGDEAGRRYVRARLREHDYELVESVVLYSPTDPWIQEEAEIGLGPIFSPKSFPKLLSRMESRGRGGESLSAGDRKVIAMRQRIYQQEGA